MLLPTPSKFRKRRGTAEAQSQTGLAITSVQRHATINEQVKIFFAAPITWDGATTPSHFSVVTDEGRECPLDVLSAGSNWIEVEFNGAVSVGATWQLNGPAAGISPAVAWPQAGVVTA